MDYLNHPSADYKNNVSQLSENIKQESLESKLKEDIKEEEPLSEALPDELNPLRDYLEPNYVGGEQER